MTFLRSLNENAPEKGIVYTLLKKSSYIYKMSNFEDANIKCKSQILIKGRLIENFPFSEIQQIESNIFQALFQFKNKLLILKIINKFITKNMNVLHLFLY